MYDFVDTEAREQLRTRVAALKRPSTYPGDVHCVEPIETHMSWVFLTERHAYKLKKPIRSSYFDYTTLEARQRACQTEVELNRRLAESVYLGVVSVTVNGTNRIWIDAEGKPIDWLVKMQRLPRRRMLDSCIERDDLEIDDIDRLAARLTRFYAAGEGAGFEKSEYRRAIDTDIAAKGVSLKKPQYGLQHKSVDDAVGRLHQWVNEHRRLLESRAGYTVDAHGDLRPEHVCLMDEPLVIDCLEFDRSLRLLDPVCELSFLALECRRLGAAWIGDVLLSTYAELSGDKPPNRLVCFYQGYHALIRAAVALWHLDDDGVDEIEKWRRRGRWYVSEIRRLL